MTAIKESTTENKCPYCGIALPRRPSRKQKCPNCDQFIYVRKSYLMTEREAALTDWASRLENLGVSRTQLDHDRSELTKQFGFDPPINDIVWRTLNSIVTKSSYVGAVKFAYLEMSHLAQLEGKNSTPYIAEAAKIELLEIKESGVVKRVRTQTVNDSLVCPNCRALAKKEIDLDEAIAKLPVPNECTNANGCRCWYIGFIDQ
jgi:predicted RNA-binding Zn-ribbon protein involved in translation (DUF1610 family)